MLGHVRCKWRASWHKVNLLLHGLDNKTTISCLIETTVNSVALVSRPSTVARAKAIVNWVVHSTLGDSFDFCLLRHDIVIYCLSE